MNDRRGITQNPLVQLAAVILIVLWVRGTYDQEPVYGRLLRRAGLSGAIVLVGAIGLAFGVAVQAWWIITWAIAVVVFLVTMYQVSVRRPYNEAWLRDRAFAERVAGMVETETEFELDEQAARVAARQMREDYLRAHGR